MSKGYEVSVKYEVRTSVMADSPEEAKEIGEGIIWGEMESISTSYGKGSEIYADRISGPVEAREVVADGDSHFSSRNARPACVGRKCASPDIKDGVYAERRAKVSRAFRGHARWPRTGRCTRPIQRDGSDPMTSTRRSSCCWPSAQSSRTSGCSRSLMRTVPDANTS